MALARLKRELAGIDETTLAEFDVPPGAVIERVKALPPELHRYWQLICIKQKQRSELQPGMKAAHDELEADAVGINREQLRPHLLKIIDISIDIVEVEYDIHLLWELFTDAFNDHYGSVHINTKGYWIVVDSTLCISSVEPKWARRSGRTVSARRFSEFSVSTTERGVVERRSQRDRRLFFCITSYHSSQFIHFLCVHEYWWRSMIKHEEFAR